MIVSCENCQRRYRIKPDTIHKLKHSIRCAHCGRRLRLSPIALAEKESRRSPIVAEDAKMTQWRAGPQMGRTQWVETPFSFLRVDLKGWINGICGKMILLFLILPAAIMVASSLISMWQLTALTKLINRENSRLAAWLAEDKSVEVCRAVAAQVGLYLKSHPRLHPTKLMQDPHFKRIAVQKVGRNRHTVLYQISNKNSSLHIWSHPDPAIIGKDLKRRHKAALSAVSQANYNQFVNIVLGARGLKESRGNYKILDANGNVRDEFRICTPIEGTPYVITVGTYTDDFVLPVQQVETRAAQQTTAIARIIILTTAVTLTVIAFAVFLFGQRLRWHILQLIQQADRIGMGDLKGHIKTDRTDELGDLAGAIGRLRDSMRLALRRPN